MHTIRKMEGSRALLGLFLQVSLLQASAGDDVNLSRDVREQTHYSLGFLSSIPEVAGSLDTGYVGRSSNSGMHVSQVTTAVSPLEKLLNNFYGNPNWRQQIDGSNDKGNNETAAFSAQEYSATQSPIQQGFLGMQVSGNSFNLEVNSGQIRDNPAHNNGESAMPVAAGEVATHAAGLLKSVFKVVGSQDHNGGRQDTVPNYRVATPDQTSQSQLSLSQVLQQHSQPDTQLHATSNPLQMTLPHALAANANNGIFASPTGLANGETDQHLSQTHNNNNLSFNPDNVNNQRNMFQPGTSFGGFITQTGSNPDNNKDATNYDPNKVNKDYLNRVINGVFETPSEYGSSSEHSLYGSQQSGFRLSEFRNAQHSTFDANALNRALTQQQEVSQQQNMRPSFLFGSNFKESPTIRPSTNAHEHMTANRSAPSVKPSPRINSFVTKTLPAEPSTSRRPTQVTPNVPKFGFIPGNLFPGQSYSSGIQQEVALPNFVHNVPIDTSEFDPNKLNAAQNVFDPNSVSWIRSKRDNGAYKDVNQAYFYGINGKSDSGIVSQIIGNQTTSTTTIATNNVKPIKVSTNENSTTSTTPTAISKPSNTPQTPFKTHANITLSSISIESPSTVAPTKQNDTQTSLPKPSYAPGGFNANRINSMQTSFVPGQMTGMTAYGGGSYMSKTYENTDPKNATDSSNQGQYFKGGGLGIGASMNFNILTLLGMGKTSNVTTTFGGGMEMFNPNMINNILSNPTDDKANMSTVRNEMETVNNSGSLFDPNAANVGFGNVLKGGFGFTQKGNSSAFGMAFDPNAANVGFGASGFGMGDGGANSFTTSFDPNRLNVIGSGLGNSNPNATTGRINGMMGYFLGVSGGGSNNMTMGVSSSNFISEFNPDVVNQVSYNPDDFNSGRMHFTPVDMLSSNPGIDKDTLKAAASAFDPDKLNNPNAQLAFSPIDMLSGNPGFNKETLAHVNYSPDALNTNKKPASNASLASNVSSNIYQQGSNQQTVFDPVAVMKKLLQAAGAYTSGLSGAQTQSFDPMASMLGMQPLPGSMQLQQTTTSVPVVTSTQSPLQTPLQTTLNTGNTSESSTAPTTVALQSSTSKATPLTTALTEQQYSSTSPST